MKVEGLRWFGDIQQPLLPLNPHLSLADSEMQNELLAKKIFEVVNITSNFVSEKLDQTLTGKCLGE